MSDITFFGKKLSYLVGGGCSYLEWYSKMSSKCSLVTEERSLFLFMFMVDNKYNFQKSSRNGQ
jgi:hypothetical protein